MIPTAAGTKAQLAVKSPAALLPFPNKVPIPGSELPEPCTEYLGGVRWRLHEDYDYRDREWTIHARAGYVFNLASVPRLLWAIIAPFDLSVVATLLHDLLYAYGGALPDGWIEPRRVYSRREADDLFARVMAQENVSAWRREAAYRAVRWFGADHWRDRSRVPTVETGLFV